MCDLQGETYLGLVKDGAVAVEELKGRYELALHQAACEHSRSCPPSCTDRHLPEPCLERKATAIANHLVHSYEWASKGAPGSWRLVSKEGSGGNRWMRGRSGRFNCDLRGASWTNAASASVLKQTILDRAVE